MVKVPQRHLGQGHLTPLDGVRGLAILMVICSHAFSANFDSGGSIARFLGNVLRYGHFGVDLFFVLSGFLITGILVDSVDGEGFFSKFYARRVLRIFPIYYAVLILLFLLTPVLHLSWDGMGWLLVGYLQNLRPDQIVVFSPGARISLNHFWSLAIEEQFYLVWPAVIFLIRDRRKLLLVTLAGSVAALFLRFFLFNAGFSQASIHVNTLARADSLLLGGSLALLYRSTYWERSLKFAPWGFLSAASILLFSIVYFGEEFSSPAPLPVPRGFWISGPRYTVLALASACLIAWSLAPHSFCGWIFRRKSLRFMGKYSYGIYVLHMIVLAPLVGVQRNWILAFTHSKALAVAGSGLSSLALAVVAAYFCFQFYEKPFLRLKRYFDYEPRATTSASAVSTKISRKSLVNS
jgi:peptidoglycan/LPS O-acetylase OafA/YrhL